MKTQDPSMILESHDDLLSAAQAALVALEQATYAMEFHKWHWNSVASDEMRRSAVAKNRSAIDDLKGEIARRRAQSTAPSVGSMKREERHVVIKHADVDKALTQKQRGELFRICANVLAYCQRGSKVPLKCVVVEHGWPGYEPTWRAIAARVVARSQPRSSFEAVNYVATNGRSFKVEELRLG